MSKKTCDKKDIMQEIDTIIRMYNKYTILRLDASKSKESEEKRNASFDSFIKARYALASHALEEGIGMQSYPVVKDGKIVVEDYLKISKVVTTDYVTLQDFVRSRYGGSELVGTEKVLLDKGYKTLVTIVFPQYKEEKGIKIEDPKEKWMTSMWKYIAISKRIKVKRKSMGEANVNILIHLVAMPGEPYNWEGIAGMHNQLVDIVGAYIGKPIIGQNVKGGHVNITDSGTIFLYGSSDSYGKDYNIESQGMFQKVLKESLPDLMKICIEKGLVGLKKELDPAMRSYVAEQVLKSIDMKYVTHYTIQNGKIPEIIVK